MSPEKRGIKVEHFPMWIQLSNPHLNDILNQDGYLCLNNLTKQVYVMPYKRNKINQ
jgi:hypothetical protein